MFSTNMTVKEYMAAGERQHREELRKAEGIRNAWQSEVDRLKRLVKLSECVENKTPPE